MSLQDRIREWLLKHETKESISALLAQDNPTEWERTFKATASEWNELSKMLS